ncbi:MAG: class A beta-lactamase-related serine hydrolase [Chloroflexi bacterium]|nr:class A beta-lactamase-related serine hydrolase [Chloroflexota bacterium]
MFYGSAPRRTGDSTLLGRRAFGRLVAGTLATAPFVGPELTAEDLPPDFAIENGHHYRQGSPEPDAGFAVFNGRRPWWDVYRRAGGPQVLGYPISLPYARDGLAVQAFSHGAIQSPFHGANLAPANVLDQLDAAGYTPWLYDQRQVPLPLDAAAEAEARLAWMTDDAIRAAYFGNPAPTRFLSWSRTQTLQRFGLPMSQPQRFGATIVQRFQRGVLERNVDRRTVRERPVGRLLVELGLVTEDRRRPVSSTDALLEAAGRTIHERLSAAVRARIRSEPGTWAVWAANSGANRPLVAIEPDRTMRTLSVWKVLLLREAFRQRAGGLLTFGEMLTMDETVVERADPPVSLEPGQQIDVGTALKHALSVSDNATAILLGDRVGYQNIDFDLRREGLKVTTINVNEPLTTAREMADVLERIVGLRPGVWQPRLAEIQAMRGLLLSETRTDRIPRWLRRHPVAHKTGDFPDAANDAGVVYTAMGPVTVVALVDRTPNRERTAAAIADVARMIVDAVDPPVVKGTEPAG